jgi:hypothetical protein
MSRTTLLGVVWDRQQVSTGDLEMAVRGGVFRRGSQTEPAADTSADAFSGSGHEGARRVARKPAVHGSISHSSTSLTPITSTTPCDVRCKALFDDRWSLPPAVDPVDLTVHCRIEGFLAEQHPSSQPRPLANLRGRRL